jgi:2-polyprenyl-3-methyl-5-hydroxy-6-metoxy-1,4-benzoquinol methylase
MASDELLPYYDGYDEEGRLDRDNCHRLEFLTTVHYLDRILAPRARVLDVAAGTGRYAFYLAGKGHQVTARDIVPAHVEAMRRKAAASQSRLDIGWGDARDLAAFEPESFDAVLCMGPMYHLHEPGERRAVVGECGAATCWPWPTSTAMGNTWPTFCGTASPWRRKPRRT